MISFKPHWTPGKIWVFYWDEAGEWALMTPSKIHGRRTFGEILELVNGKKP